MATRGLLITGGADKSVRLWDLRDGRCVRSFDARAPVNSVSLSNNGLLVAVGGQDGGVRLFDIRSSAEGGGKPAHEALALHAGAVTCVAFSRHDASARLLTASRDSTLRIVDGRTLEPVPVVRHAYPHPHPHPGGPYGPLSSTSSAASSSGGLVSTALGGLLGRFGGSDSGTASASASPSASASASASAAHAPIPASSSLVMRHPSFRAPGTNTAHAVLSPTGLFAAAGGANGTIYAWSADTGEVVTALPEHASAAGPGADASASATAAGGVAGGSGPHASDAVLGIDWSPDGRYMASADASGRVVFWYADR